MKPVKVPVLTWPIPNPVIRAKGVAGRTRRANRRMRSMPGRLWIHGGAMTPRTGSSVTGLGIVLTSAPPPTAICPRLPSGNDDDSEPLARIVVKSVSASHGYLAIRCRILVGSATRQMVRASV
jgi:hypothetical protein